MEPVSATGRDKLVLVVTIS